MKVANPNLNGSGQLDRIRFSCIEQNIPFRAAHPDEIYLKVRIRIQNFKNFIELYLYKVLYSSTISNIATYYTKFRRIDIKMNPNSGVSRGLDRIHFF